MALDYLLVMLLGVGLLHFCGVAAPDPLADRPLLLFNMDEGALATSAAFWYSDSWPGLLALMCSPHPADKATCQQLLCADIRAFLHCKTLEGANTFLANCVRTSPFSAKPLPEIKDPLTLVGNVMAPDSVEQLQSLSDKIFGGCGQTKVIEDVSKEVREKESRAVASKLVSMVRQWDCLRTKDVIAKHGKEELDPTPYGPGVPAAWPEVTEELFTTAQHSPTIDALSICSQQTGQYGEQWSHDHAEHWAARAAAAGSSGGEAPAAAAFRAAGSGGGGGGPPADVLRLPEELSVATLQPLLPPQAQLWESAREGRIRVFYKVDRTSTSAAILKYGAAKACVWCLQWAWRRECALNGRQCPVVGLME